MTYLKKFSSALVATALCIVAFMGPVMAEPFFASPTDAEMARLEKGEIITTGRTLPGTSVNEFTAVGIVKANWETSSSTTRTSRTPVSSRMRSPRST